MRRGLPGERERVPSSEEPPGQPCVKHWYGLGVQQRGEGHVTREVKYKISAVPEEASVL